MSDRKEYQRKYYEKHKTQKKEKMCGIVEATIKPKSKYNQNYIPKKYDIRKVINILEEWSKKEQMSVKRVAIKYGYESELDFFNKNN